MRGTIYANSDLGTEWHAWDEELILKDAIQYYAHNNTPLSRCGVKDLVEEFVALLGKQKRDEFKFVDSRPSDKWIDGFICLRGLKY